MFPKGLVLLLKRGKLLPLSLTRRLHLGEHNRKPEQLFPVAGFATRRDFRFLIE
jgi:hypothetical protein